MSAFTRQREREGTKAISMMHRPVFGERKDNKIMEWFLYSNTYWNLYRSRETMWEHSLNINGWKLVAESGWKWKKTPR
jgi:hypothetical protein